MKLLPWRLGRHNATAAAPRFVPALDRVREMREHTTWEPVTLPENIQQRAERVATARQHIAIPPLAGERQTHPGRGSRFDPWLDSLRLFLYGVLLILLAVMLVIHVVRPQPEPAPNIESSTVTFPLPDSYPYASLTDAQALQFARRAFRESGIDLSDWWADTQGKSYPVYLRRINDYEGTLVFRHRHYFSEVIEVTLKVQMKERRVVCTINPR